MCFHRHAVAAAIALRASATAGLLTPVRPSGSTGPTGSGFVVGEKRAAPRCQPCLRSLALAILCLSNPFPVAIVQAQTETTLVSNAGQTSDPTLDISNAISQSFTTGSQDGGYAFTTVDVHLGTQPWDGGCKAMGSVAVSIYSNDAQNEPGTEVHALTAPDTLTTGFNTFTAPSNATLSADTNYHVHITVSGDDLGNTDWCIGTTSSTGEDDGGVAGWSIGDTWIFGALPGDAWNTLSGAVLIKIARVDPAPTPTPTPTPDPDPDPDPGPDPGPNRAPTVTASCKPCSVGPEGEVRLTAEARDRDGDSLTYQWTAPKGWLKDATRATARWRPSKNETGRVAIRVRVSDGTAGASAVVRVDVDPMSVPALPLGGAVLLGLLLAGVGRRRGRTAQ